ncbi:MAG: argininosuccinate lyase [Rikenellaceae bacterium]|nr:argininosuccinate lyase [Rikenellaceae bacterium]MCL2692128.1 argininosuccinate lyase [Rikenellaceae bacterium]
MATLWSKGTAADEAVEKFTVGRDREFDLRLARFDVEGSLAHVEMLAGIGLLTPDEHATLDAELKKILVDIEAGAFALEDDVEDVHSQVELLLTRRVGDVGKKIHSGRSRNDQVLVDLKLYLKWEIGRIREAIAQLFGLLQTLSERHKDVLMPGYTHTQAAMPSSFGLWFGAYAETLVDDLYALFAAWKSADQNPLGSAAGYGCSFPLDRDQTTRLLGFGDMAYNVVAAQMGRGKTEKAVAVALAAVGATLGRLADDCTLFMNGNYGFISFPDALTTGSSIMPHKKNPDVWEIVRGRCNRLQSVPNEIALLTTNMTHGYHRDYQLLKEVLFPALDSFHEVAAMVALMLENIRVNANILDDARYDCLFTVEEVNRLALGGMPFRDAYREVGRRVAEGTYIADKTVSHSHAGSIGNLCTAEIRRKFDGAVALFR